MKLNYGNIVGGSSGEDSSYIRNIPMTINVGGANIGTTFNGTTSDALDKILYPNISPNFTAFTISGVGLSYEVGQLLPAGNRTANWATSASANVKPNSIEIVDVNNSNTVLATGLANTGNSNISMPNIVYNTPTNHAFRINGESTTNSIFQRILTVSWMNRVYFGESVNDILTESDILNLRTSLLLPNVNGDYIFNPLIGGYKWICYPSTMGLKTSFLDPNTGFPVAINTPPEIVPITNSFGVTQNYYCYRTFNAISGNLTIRII